MKKLTTQELKTMKGGLLPNCGPSEVYVSCPVNTPLPYYFCTRILGVTYPCYSTDNFFSCVEADQVPTGCVILN